MRLGSETWRAKIAARKLVVNSPAAVEEKKPAAKGDKEEEEEEEMPSEKGKKMMKSTYSSITTHLKKKAKTRYETLEGRQYLVVPMVMMVEGVHCGSAGCIYYPAEELAKFPGVWNTKPIVVYHPTQNGEPISASDPVILENRKIGLVMQAEWKKGKLTAEAWLDVEKTKVVDNRILEAIEKGEMVELSTGLWSENELSDGEWNGEKYWSIARNHRPDHLAILPDQIGACSIKDGAGLLRNAVSFEATRDLLRTTLMEGYPQDYCYIVDVFQGFVVYEKAGKLWKQNYSATDIQASLVGEPELVVRVVQYRTTDGTVVGNYELESMDMKKTEMVEKLIKNSNGVWQESDRAHLMTLSEERLGKFIKNVEEEKAKPPEQPAAPTPTQAPAPAAAPSAPAPAANSAPKPVTMEEYIAAAPPEFRDVLVQSARTHAAEKQKVIATIVGNKKNVFKPEYLATKSLEELQAIANLAAPEPAPASSPFLSLPVANFAALGDGATPAPGKAEVPMDLPTLNFEAAK